MQGKIQNGKRANGRAGDNFFSPLLRFALSPFLVLLTLVPGCIHPRDSANRPTNIDPKQATADFWFDRPAVTSVDSPSFNRLWDAAERAARFHRFEMDRNDQRLGVMTTLPLLSKTIWEVWRNDLPHIKDQMRSTLAEYRQLIRYDFSRLPDGTYRVTPRVVLERHVQRDHRVTIAANYQLVFYVNPDQYQDYSIDQPVTPIDYWYATGRDYGLERELAHDIRHRIESQ